MKIAGHRWYVTLGAFLVLELVLMSSRALAHKGKHTPEQLKAFEEVFIEQVKIGDQLFHGDEALQKKFNIKLSRTGMACAMCHPFATDTHPYQFPKFQGQVAKFAVLRDMINWCVENSMEGERIDPDSDAMKSLEAYIYWSNRDSKLDPGRH